MNELEKKKREIEEIEKLLLSGINEMQLVVKELMEGPVSKESKAKNKILLQNGKALRQKMKESRKAYDQIIRDIGVIEI